MSPFAPRKKRLHGDQTGPLFYKAELNPKTSHLIAIQQAQTLYVSLREYQHPKPAI